MLLLLLMFPAATAAHAHASPGTYPDGTWGRVWGVRVLSGGTSTRRGLPSPSSASQLLIVVAGAVVVLHLLLLLMMVLLVVMKRRTA